MEALVLSYAATKVVDILGARFKDGIIGRWSHHRSEQFFRAFASEIEREQSGEVESDKLTKMLEQVVEDEHASEAMFDAYRRVALSASKTVGPRIIGLLAARIALQKRTADENEERIFIATEAMTDDDLYNLYRYLVRGNVRAKQVAEGFGGEDLVIEVEAERYDSNFPNPESFSPVDLYSSLGLWAIKLRNAGLLTEEVKQVQEQYFEDSDRHVDMDGITTVRTWYIRLASPVADLIQLIERAAPDFALAS